MVASLDNKSAKIYHVNMNRLCQMTDIVVTALDQLVQDLRLVVPSQGSTVMT